MSNEDIKNTLIEEVRSLAERLGRTPTSKEFRSVSSLSRVSTNFETWNNFLSAAGLEINASINNYDHLTDEELLKLMKKEITRIGSTTFESFYKNKSKGIPSFSYIQNRFNVKWNEFLELLDLEINLKDMTKEELIGELKSLSEELGKTPSIIDLTEKGISLTKYINAFETYNKALEESGLDIHFIRNKVTHSDEELLQMYIDLCNRLGKTATLKDIDNHLEYKADVFVIRFGGINALRKLAGVESRKSNHRYTKRELEEILTELYKKHNRRLTNKEFKELSKNNEVPCMSTLMRYFKTTKMAEVWEEIENKLDIKGEI